MSSRIIEDLSGCKFKVLVGFLLLCQLLCFLIGWLFPIPASEILLATACKDVGPLNNCTIKWVYSQGKDSCKSVDLTMINGNSSDDIVFAFHMPIPRKLLLLDYSRWQQNLFVMLQIDIRYQTQTKAKLQSTMTLDTHLGYRDLGESDDAWKLYAQNVMERELNCVADNEHKNYIYNCSAMPLFELASPYHDYFLLNVRLPPKTDGMAYVIHVENMRLIVTSPYGGFTIMWFSLKIMFLLSILPIIIWFRWRIHYAQRKPNLLENMLMSQGICMCLLNIPLEFLRLEVSVSNMLLLGDIIQTVLYANMLLFWLVFTGEDMLIQDTNAQSSLKYYWIYSIVIAIGTITLFTFNILQIDAQLHDLEFKNFETNLIFIIVVAILIGMYFTFLCTRVWKVFVRISSKRSSLLNVCSKKKLRYEIFSYRFKFLMSVTLLCAALTGLGMILGQAVKGNWLWYKIIDQYTTGLLTGIYGMWNIYTIAMLILYAPQNPPLRHSSTTEFITHQL